MTATSVTVVLAVLAFEFVFCVLEDKQRSCDNGLIYVVLENLEFWKVGSYVTPKLETFKYRELKYDLEYVYGNLVFLFRSKTSVHR